MIPPRTEQSNQGLSSGQTEKAVPGPDVHDRLQVAFRDLSRARDPCAPLDARDAIFSAAAAQIQGRAAWSVGGGRALSLFWMRLQHSLSAPWPYAAATAMLALVAVTVALRVQPEADQAVRTEASAQMSQPARAANESSTKPDEAPGQRQTGAVVKEDAATSRDSKESTLENEVKASPNPPQKAVRADNSRVAAGRLAMNPSSSADGAVANGTPAARAVAQPSKPSEASARSGSSASQSSSLSSPPSSSSSSSSSSSKPEGLAKQALPALGAVPSGLSDKPQVELAPGESRSEAESMARRARSSTEGSGSPVLDWIAELVPSQARAKTLAILADHGALPIASAEGAAPVRRPQAFGASEFDQVFQLREGGLLRCRFRPDEGAKEDVLVRCRKQP